jgi:hypothetical protein
VTRADTTAPRAASKRASAKTRSASERPASRRSASKRSVSKVRAPARKRAGSKDNAQVKSAKGRATTTERAPRQGFEAEPDSHGPVQPPGSSELVSSAAELAGELAKAGVTTGARVLRDFLSRLPG